MAFQPHVPEVVTPIVIEDEVDGVWVQCPVAQYLLFRDWQNPAGVVLETDHCIYSVIVYLPEDILSPYAGFHSNVCPPMTETVSTTG